MVKKSGAGKGDAPRPCDRDKYEEGYMRIYHCEKCGKHKNICTCSNVDMKGT
jgi:hypothetical protein